MKTINLNGDLINIGFNLGVMLAAEEMFGEAVDQLVTDNSLSAVSRLAYCCVQVNNEGVPPFGEWLKEVRSAEDLQMLFGAVREEMEVFYRFNPKFAEKEKGTNGEGSKNG